MAVLNHAGMSIQISRSCLLFLTGKPISFEYHPGWWRPVQRVLAAMFLIMTALQWVPQPVHAGIEPSHPIPAWPLIYHRADQDHAETDILWPIFRYEREKSLARYALRPLLFSTESDPNKDYRKTSVIWPLGIYQRTGSELSFQIFPVYWAGRSTDSRHTVFFPLYWDIQGQDYSYFHLWPLLGVNHYGKSSTEYSTLYPFFRYGHDPNTGETDLHFFWPLVNYYVKGDYHTNRVLPIYWYERGPDQSGGFLFPYYWRYTPTFTSRGIFPLWFSSRGPEIRTDLVFPIYFNRETPTDHLRFVTPLYFSRSNPESHLNMLIPVFLNYGTQKEQLQFIIPFYFSRQTEDSRLHTFIPVFLNYETPYERLRFITPLYVSIQTDESHLSSLIPVYLNYQKNDFGLQIGLPVYLRYRSGPYSFSTFFPVYYHSEDTQLRAAFTYYFPIYGSYQRGDAISRHFILFPLYSHLEDSHLQLKAWDVVWPLFHYESSPSMFSVHMLPFYWHTQTPEYGLTYGFPLYWSYTSGQDSYWHLLPLYGVHTQGDWYTKRFILGPVFMATQDKRNGLSQQDFLFLIFSRRHEGDSEQSWLIPFYFHRKSADFNLTLGSLALLPPYYIHREELGEDFFHLWPIYGHWRKGDYEDYSTLWPVVSFAHDGDNEKSWVIPFYYHRGDSDSRLTLGSLALLPPYYINIHQPDQDLFHVWPLFGRLQRVSYLEYSTLWPLIRFGSDSENGISMTHFLLYFHKREKEDSITTLFPIWWRSSSPQRTLDSTLFLHWYDHDAQKDETHLSFLWLIPPKLSLIRYEAGPHIVRHSFFPLYSYDQNDETDALSWSILWLLFSYNSQGEFVRETGFLWKVITYERKDAQTSDFRFLWRVIRSSTTATSSTFELNPLYYHESEAGKGSYWALLGGLIGRETTEEGGSKMQWLWIF
jgi:hypothetical protein